MELQGWNPALTWLCGTPRNPNLEFPAEEKQVLTCHSSSLPSVAHLGHISCVPYFSLLPKSPKDTIDDGKPSERQLERS